MAIVLAPIPYVVETSGEEADAPSGAIPIALYGASADAPTAEVAALTPLAGDADLPTAVAKINQIIAALQA